jgi:hypothetical protein
MKFIFVLLFFCQLSFAECDLIYQSGFEKVTTRVALSKLVGGVTHVGWLDIDSDTWFDVTNYLDANFAATGIDAWFTISSDARFYLLETERPVEYQGWHGLTWGTLDANGIPSEPIVVDGAPHPEGFSSIASCGMVMTMILQDNAGRRDVWLVTRSGNQWLRNDEINLSMNSAGSSNGGAVFAKDNNKVMWTSYTGSGMDFDENNLTGNNFTHILSHTRLGNTAQIIRPSYEKEGTIIFEGELNGEQCYRYNPFTPNVEPYVIDNNYSNDNSCSALPDGRIASFWLERPGGPSVHEMRIMSVSGIHESVLQLNTDFWDFLITGGTYTP